jgi:1,4-alpha-glucan branching enzyme
MRPTTNDRGLGFHMKNNKSKRLNRNGSSLPWVHFEYMHPTATAVYIAGTFNDWRPQATPMVPLGNGHWMKDLTLPPGQYEYRIVAHGEWMADPMARETNPNPFGGLNSVLKVEGGVQEHVSIRTLRKLKL